MKASIQSLLALGAVALAAPAQTTNTSAPAAQVKNGSYVGVHNANYDQDYFLGLPYAQPPVGELRFAQAQSLNKTWEGVKQASEYSSACYGYGSDQWGYELSEDCLYLNVIRPSGYEDQQLPVAFWIHGGGFTEGSAGDLRYNLSFIVENSVKIGKPIIGVSTNYRLAGWGFLSSDEVEGRGLTNVGLRDQRLALHWVQENIAAFGGDPTKVAIWGESAGAASVGFQITAYKGRDDKLFRAGIMESGNPIYYGTLNSSQYVPQYNDLVSRANCTQSLDKIQCLRELPTSTLNDIFNSTGSMLTNWGPVLDGDFNVNYGSLQLERGEFVHVPIIDGANSDEGGSFGPRGINTTEQFAAYLRNQGNPEQLVQQFLEAYPANDTSEQVLASLGNNPAPASEGVQFRRAASYAGDYTFIASRRRTCQTWASSDIPAYCYRFNAIPAGSTYVEHFSEVSFVFNNIQGNGYGIYPSVSTKPFEGKPQSYEDLSYLMSCSWVSFVVDLDPNGWKTRPEDVEKWPAYSLDDPKDIVWDANVTSHVEKDDYRAEGIRLINDNAAGVYER